MFSDVWKLLSREYPGEQGKDRGRFCIQAKQLCSVWFANSCFSRVRLTACYFVTMKKVSASADWLVHDAHLILPGHQGVQR